MLSKIIDKFRNRKLDCMKLVEHIMLNPSFDEYHEFLNEFEVIKKYFSEFRMIGKVLPVTQHWNYIDVDTGIHTGRMQRLTNDSKRKLVFGQLLSKGIELTLQDGEYIQGFTMQLEIELSKIEKLEGEKYSVALEQKLNS